MTKAKVVIGTKEYSFEGDDAEDALNSIKYSTIPLRLVRAMGVKWTKKILWPTFASLQDGGKTRTTASLSLPSTLTSLLKKNTSGNLRASLDMNLNTQRFEASAKGEFTAEGLNFAFESDIDEAESTGLALRDSLNLISSYNVDVDEITFSVSPDKNPKTAAVDIDADVPSNLMKKDYSFS